MVGAMEGEEGEAQEQEVRWGAAVLSPQHDLWARLIAIGTLVVLGALVLAGAAGTTSASLAAAFLLVALVVLAVPLSRLRNLKSFKALGVELELAEEAIEAAPTAKLTEEKEKEQEQGGGIVDLQLFLEAKLAYVAKIIIGFDDKGHWSSFLNVGSLEHDGYLSKEDAIAARRLLGLRPSDIRGATPQERDEYLKRARPFVRGIQATVFHRIVRQVLDEDFGADTRECDRGPGKRPDLQVQDGDAAGALVFPAFVGTGRYWNAERIRERAEELSTLAEKAMIVVPPRASVKDPGIDRVRLIRLDQLVHAGRGKAASKLADVLVPPAA